MLFAVEGGGFFSASASGYSKGLALLLLGQKNEDRPMRVLPWNQCQLAEQKSNPDHQLASVNNRLSCRCASFVCFGRTSAGVEVPSNLKVGPVQQHDEVPRPLVSETSKDTTDPENFNNARKVAIKSSLKRSSNSVVLVEDGNEDEGLSNTSCAISGHVEKRKVQWTDVYGSELVQIKEFEPRGLGYSAYDRSFWSVGFSSEAHAI